MTELLSKNWLFSKRNGLFSSFSTFCLQNFDLCISFCFTFISKNVFFNFIFQLSTQYYDLNLQYLAFNDKILTFYLLFQHFFILNHDFLSPNLDFYLKISNICFTFWFSTHKTLTFYLICLTLKKFFIWCFNFYCKIMTFYEKNLIYPKILT